MKKILSSLLCLCLLLTLLAGCSQPSKDASQKTDAPSNSENKPAQDAPEGTTSSEPVVVTIWGLWQPDNYRAKWMQEKGNEYAAQFENVKVEYIFQNSYNGVAEKLTAGAMSGELPTLAQMEESFISMFHPICLNFKDYMSEEKINNFNDGLMVTGKWEDKVLAVPANRSAPVLYLNKDIIDQCGLDPAGPQTWDDLYEYAKTIKEKTGKYGFTVYWDSDAWIWESALYSWGGQITSDDGKTATFNDNGAGSKVIELYQKMIKEGYATQPFSEVKTDDSSDWNATKFLEQEVAMVINSCGTYGSLKKNAQFNIQVNFMPEGTQRSMVTGGANWILPKGSSEEEIKHAVGFIEYISNDENNLDWMKTSGYMASTKSVMTSEGMLKEFETDPNYKVILEQMNHAHARPTTPYWREMYTYIVEKLEASVMDPTLDAKALIDDCVAKCQSIIDANS